MASAELGSSRIGGNDLSSGTAGVNEVVTNYDVKNRFPKLKKNSDNNGTLK